jgi:hypothetical protein
MYKWGEAHLTELAGVNEGHKRAGRADHRAFQLCFVNVSLGKPRFRREAGAGNEGGLDV